MSRLELRKPAPPDTYLALRDENKGTTDGGLGSTIGLLIVGSGLFAFAGAALAPSVPAWLVPSIQQEPERVTIMYALVAIVEWATLAALTVAPVVVGLVAINRLWMARALRNAADATRRRTYGAVAVVTLAASIPIWFLAWQHAMTPIMESLLGKLVLFGFIFVLGLYSLKNSRNVN